MVVTEEERAKLEAVAKAARRSAADWIRLKVDEAYELIRSAKPSRKRNP